MAFFFCWIEKKEKEKKMVIIGFLFFSLKTFLRKILHELHKKFFFLFFKGGSSINFKQLTSTKWRGPLNSSFIVYYLLIIWCHHASRSSFEKRKNVAKFRKLYKTGFLILVPPGGVI